MFIDANSNFELFWIIHFNQIIFDFNNFSWFVIETDYSFFFDTSDNFELTINLTNGKSCTNVIPPTIN